MSAFLTIAIVHLLAVMSPGPDFAVTLRNSIVYTRKTGIWTALGIGLGIFVHVAYCIAGIGLVISQSIILFNTMKYLGAGYLIFIGWKAMTAKAPSSGEIDIAEHVDLSIVQSIRIGFLTNALNPKATLFFLSLFTYVVEPTTSIGVQLFYGSYMAVASFVWFAFVACLLNQQHIKRAFQKIQLYFERGMGVCLIALGLKVALSRR